MKTRTRIFGILTVMATVIFMDACKGEKGDIGPSGANGVGTTGATGGTGLTEPKGDAGTSTTTGSNNVIQVTFTKTFVPPSPLDGTQIFVFPAVVTTDMLNNSGLIIYIKTSDYPGSWVAVPRAGIANAGVADVLRYTFHAGQQEILVLLENQELPLLQLHRFV